MAARDYINRDLFHASDLPEEELMKAPAIHVGTYEQAAARSLRRAAKLKETVPVHSTPLSEHAKVFPVTLTDRQANRVHLRFLSERGMGPPPSVYTSSVGDDNFDHDEYVRDSLIEGRALAAMNRNEVIRYMNSAETPNQRTGEEAPDPHSYLVPSPVINLSQMSQRALPMDYSGMVESTITKHMRTKHGKSFDDLRGDYGEANERAKHVQRVKEARRQRTERIEENRRKRELNTNTGSLIDPDVVWPDPQLPGMP